jgi:hypothetical protein
MILEFDTILKYFREFNRLIIHQILDKMPLSTPRASGTTERFVCGLKHGHLLNQKLNET